MKYFIVFITLICTLSSVCFGKHQVCAITFDEFQEEYFYQGYKTIVSKKKNTLSMTCRKNFLCNRRGWFCVSLLNNGTKPVNLYVSNIRVFDQEGRTINIVPISKQLQTADSDYKWNLFFSGLGLFFKMFEAEEAGKSYEKGVVYGSSGMAVFEGEVNNNYLRRKAYKEVSEEAVGTNTLIQWHRDAVCSGLKRYYLDTTTLFPGKVHAANLEIEISKKILKNLKYLVFEYDLPGERHSFCFYVS